MIQRRIDLDRERQARAHADLQQMEVRAHQFELPAERCALAAQLRQRRTQITHQADDHFRTGLRLSAIQTPHVAQHVEQEVGFDLGLKQRQLLFGLVMSQLHAQHLRGMRGRVELQGSPVDVGDKYEEDRRQP